MRLIGQEPNARWTPKKVFGLALGLLACAWLALPFWRMAEDVAFDQQNIFMWQTVAAIPCVLNGAGHVKEGYRLQGRMNTGLRPTTTEVWSERIPPECRAELASKLNRPDRGVALEWAPY